MRFGSLLDHVSERLRGNKEVVMAAVLNDPFSIRDAAMELRDDPDLVEMVLAHPAMLIVDVRLLSGRRFRQAYDLDDQSKAQCVSMRQWQRQMLAMQGNSFWDGSEEHGGGVIHS